MGKLTAFPTTFPADAASKIGHAIVTKAFSTDLIEPLYDLIGFGLGRLFGSSTPSPVPVPVPTGRTFGAGLEEDHAAQAEHVLQVGDMLNAAADAHRYATATAEGGDKFEALPWGTILSVLVTILQGLLLAVEPSPIPKPADPK